jgi:hypothetical protein
LAQNEQTQQLATQVTGNNDQAAGNSLGIDVGKPGISRQDLEAGGLAGSQNQSKTASATEQNSQAVAVKSSENAQLMGSNIMDTPLLNLNAENQIPAEDTYGETVVGGMKVTLLNLDASEKEAVQMKVYS